jgi:hypothetical protein
MIESDATRLRMIKAVGGVLVRHDAGTFWAIFDREFALSVDGVVESRQPVITARTSDVSALAKDTVLTICDENFRIKRHEPDGTGMSVVVLKH